MVIMMCICEGMPIEQECHRLMNGLERDRVIVVQRRA